MITAKIRAFVLQLWAATCYCGASSDASPTFDLAAQELIRKHSAMSRQKLARV